MAWSGVLSTSNVYVKNGMKVYFTGVGFAQNPSPMTCRIGAANTNATMTSPPEAVSNTLIACNINGFSPSDHGVAVTVAIFYNQNETNIPAFSRNIYYDASIASTVTSFTVESIKNFTTVTEDQLPNISGKLDVYIVNNDASSDPYAIPTAISVSTTFDPEDQARRAIKWGSKFRFFNRTAAIEISVDKESQTGNVVELWMVSGDKQVMGALSVSANGQKTIKISLGGTASSVCAFDFNTIYKLGVKLTSTNAICTLSRGSETKCTTSIPLASTFNAKEFFKNMFDLMIGQSSISLSRKIKAADQSFLSAIVQNLAIECQPGTSCSANYTEPTTTGSAPAVPMFIIYSVVGGVAAILVLIVIVGVIIVIIWKKKKKSQRKNPKELDAVEILTSKRNKVIPIEEGSASKYVNSAPKVKKPRPKKPRKEKVEATEKRQDAAPAVTENTKLVEKKPEQPIQTTIPERKPVSGAIVEDNANPDDIYHPEPLDYSKYYNTADEDDD
jgi:hypothetical protein